MPATCFVIAAGAREVEAQFLSTVMELPMCGHGTLGLMTRLVELGILDWEGTDEINVTLKLPSGPAQAVISRRDDNRPHVMLDVRSPSFSRGETDTDRLARLLGLDTSDFSANHPIETARADFIHLVVPIKGLSSMRKITPDFAGLVLFCHDHGVETVAVFCEEVERSDSTIHVRDFCPAVGVLEAAAAGTTNAALTGYLVRHGIARANGDGHVSVLAEQGHEINRPSNISSLAWMEGSEIARLQVGGVATKVMDGALHL
jgi:PhzF family phenazine biosynthesis protein